MSAGRDPLWRVAGPPALAMAVVLLLTASRHGWHGDELYFRMLPLRWWYEDQPPLTVWASHAAARLSDEVWVQRLPAVVAGAASTLVAALFPRLLRHDARVQRVAAWAHAFTVYPLVVGHVFLTAGLDLLAWQVVTLLVVAAGRGHRHALTWAGVVAGLACWNKLLVLVLVAALGLGLLVGRRDLLATWDAVRGAAALAVVGGPQVLAQAWHGWPMSAVSSDLIARHGAVNRWLVLPLLLAFVGPPFVGVLLRGAGLRPGGRPGVPVLATALLALTAWTMAFPAQPYYPLGLAMAVLALGWGASAAAGDRIWGRLRRTILANAAVSVVIALPVVPASSPAFGALATVNPVQRDQAGWDVLVRDVARADQPGSTVVSGSYALAGAIDRHGPAVGLTRVASGHNALWNMGPPATDHVLLVGAIATSHAHLFAACTPAGRLAHDGPDPFGLAGSPMSRCRSPLGGWSQAWPSFRRLGG